MDFPALRARASFGVLGIFCGFLLTCSAFSVYSVYSVVFLHMQSFFRVVRVFRGLIPRWQCCALRFFKYLVYLWFLFLHAVFFVVFRPFFVVFFTSAALFAEV